MTTPINQFVDFLYAILPQITTGIIIGVGVFVITRYKIDPELAKRDKKKKHQEEIFGIYKEWLESPFSYKVDLTDFNLDKLSITFKESFPTRLIKQGEIPKNEKEQALYHLDYDINMDDGKINGFDLYIEILEKKDDFNKRMDLFLDCNKESLENLLKLKGIRLSDWLMGSLLKFYLKTIYTSKLCEKEQDVDGFLNGVWINVINGHQLDNRIIDNKGIIIQNIKDKRKEKIKAIERFEEDIENIKKSISQFKSILELIISHESLGLESSCIIEKKLSIINRISSFFRRKK